MISLFEFKVFILYLVRVKYVLFLLFTGSPLVLSALVNFGVQIRVVISSVTVLHYYTKSLPWHFYLALGGRRAGGPPRLIQTRLLA